MIWFAVAFAAFVLTILANKLLTTVWRRLPPLLSFFGCGAFFGLLQVGGYGFQSYPAEGLAAIAWFAVACEVTLVLMTVVTTSISTSIIVHIANERMSADDLAVLYSDALMAEKRIARLTNQGLISAMPDRGHRVTAKGRRLLRALISLRAFFHATPTEMALK
jgi:hypothetical protein